MIKKTISLLSFCLLFTSLHAQKTKDEQKIISIIDKRTPAAIALLKNIVNINSGTMNFDGVRKTGTILMNELKALGFETHWSTGESFNRAGHLIAVHKGKKGPKFLLIGHLDTVFELDSPFQTYEMLNDSIMHGPGSSDMKGGIVIMILAMQALSEAGLQDDLWIEIVMTGDEELNGEPLELSKKDVIEAAKRADIALGYEDGDGLPTTAVVSRRGASEWTLKVKSTAAHSSQLFTEKVGPGAIYETSRILNAFYDSLRNEENLTFNPGTIVGGNKISFDENTNTGTAFGKSNIVAQDVMVRGDLRAVSNEQLLKAKKIMSEIVANNYSKTSAEIDFGDGGYPPMTRTDGNIKLLNFYSKVSVDLGYGPQTAVNPRNAGAADISFAADYVDMAIDAIGLAGAGGHTVNETANLNYLSVEAKRSAILIYRLGNGIFK